MNWIVYFVDDEPGDMELYRHGLKIFSRFGDSLEVRILDRADLAIAEVQKHAATNAHVLWVVDSMMPWFEDESSTDASGTDSEIETRDDASTGLELIRRLMKMSNGLDYNYIVFTQRLATEVESACKIPCLRIYEKLKHSPKALAKTVDTIISNSSR